MNRRQNWFQSLIIGCYAWVTAVFLGGSLLDMSYARYLRDALGNTAGAMVFSEVSDLLLLIGFAAIVGAFVAIAVSWDSAIIRYLLIASLLAIGAEFLIPVFAQVFQSAQVNSIGPWLRIIPLALASLLAFTGLHRYHQESAKPSLRP